MNDKGRCRSHPIFRRDAFLNPRITAKLGFGRVTRYSEQARGLSPPATAKRQGIPPVKRRLRKPREREVAISELWLLQFGNGGLEKWMQAQPPNSLFNSRVINGIIT